MGEERNLTKAKPHTWESDLELGHKQYWPLSVFLSTLLKAVGNSLPII